MIERSPHFGGIVIDKTPPEDDGSVEEGGVGGDEEGCFDMIFPPQYHNKSPENTKAIDEQISDDGKVVRRF